MRPIAPKIKGCLNCGPEVQKLSMRRELSVGFGSVDVSFNGKTVWSGDMDKQFYPSHGEMKKPRTIMTFEVAARKKPGDWRVEFNAPMNNSIFQRHGKNLWVLVEQGQGFA